MIHSFLLIGQSNMAGRGMLDGADPITNPRIKVLRNGRWQTMFTPVNPDRPFAGRSLAESFADVYARERNVDVGLIPCADGGTSIDQWVPGGLLYDNAVCQAKLAQRTSTIAGVLWHQGESDCGPERYPFYEKKLVALIDSFRKDLELSDVPFLCGGLGDFLTDCTLDETLRNYDRINRILKKLADAYQMVGYVAADGLTANSDNLHFNTRSLLAFGHRYYEAFCKIENKEKVFLEKPGMDAAVRTAMELL